MDTHAHENLESTSRPWLRPALVALLALVAHAASLWCGWIWDDDSYVTANTVIQSPDGILSIWVPGSTPQYYPLVFLGFWIQHALIGLEPFWFHMVNVLMHAANAALLFVVLKRIGVASSFWIAALFAVHPMGVETVAWVTERKNLQSMLFALASIFFFIRMLDAGKQGSARAWTASFACFVAALLSKTTAVFVPPCLVMIVVWQRRRLDAHMLLAVAPYFVLGAVLGLFTAHIERVHVGATGDEFALGVLDRLQLAGKVAVFYLAHFAIPREQVFIYPRFAVDAADLAAWGQSALCAAALIACAARWRMSRAPLLVALWIGAALFPALGFFDVWPFRYSFVADHFAYAAIPAFALVIVAMATSVGTISARLSRMGAAAGGVTLAACIVLSVRATPKYESEESLWRATLEQNPEAWIASNNIASIKLREAGQRAAQGDSAGAADCAREALVYARKAGAVNADEFTIIVNQSEAHRLLGEKDDALREIEVAAKLAPRIYDVQWLRARALESSGRVDDARIAYREAATLATRRQQEIEVCRDLLRLAVARRDFEEAASTCARIVELDPDDADMAANLGSILAAAGKPEEGRRALLRAVRRNSDAFSRTEVWVAAAVKYLRLAVETPLSADEATAAKSIVARLVTVSRDDPFGRFLQLALGVSLGDATARAPLEKLANDAAASGNTALATEVARFLASRPSAGAASW